VPISSCLSLTPRMSMPSLMPPMPMPSMSPAQSCALLVQASVIHRLPHRWLPVSSSCSFLAARVEVECDLHSTAIYLVFLTNAL
jgi:hypothetical protein